jgi:hypothetical protein
MNFKNVLLIFLLGISIVPFISGATTDFDIVNLSAKVYNYSPAPVSPGQEFNIWIQLTNNSNVPARNVSYLLDPKFPFSLSDFNVAEVTIPVIAPYQSSIIKFTLKTDLQAIDGTYDLEFKYKRDGTNTYSIEKYKIDVVSDNSVLELTNIYVSDLSIGSNGSVKINVKNLGPKNVKNIFVTLNDSEDIIKVINLKTNYFESLKVNEYISLEYSVVVSKLADKKSYTLPLEIKYFDDTKDYVISRNIGVLLNDDPKLVVNINSIGKKNNKLIANSPEIMEIEIYNIGNVDAESVYVELNSQITDVSPKYFIGSIEKDNYDNVTFEFMTKSDLKTGSYPMEIIVNYKDSNLKSQTIKKAITVEIIENKSSAISIMGIFSGLLSIVGLIIGLAILILFLRWANRVILKPAFGGFFNFLKNKFKRKKK